MPGPPGSVPVLGAPTDATQTLDKRARAWLHTNCAQCHRPGGLTPSPMDLRYATPLAATLACTVVPQSGSPGQPPGLPGNTTTGFEPRGHKRYQSADGLDQQPQRVLATHPGEVDVVLVVVRPVPGHQAFNGPPPAVEDHQPDVHQGRAHRGAQ